MAKDRFLVVRLERDDLERVRKVAEADHLDTSVWARQAILKAVDAWEKKQARAGQRTDG